MLHVSNREPTVDKEPLFLMVIHARKILVANRLRVTFITHSVTAGHST